MKLRIKILATIILAWLGLSSTAYYGCNVIIGHNIQKLAQMGAPEQIQQLNQILEVKLHHYLFIFLTATFGLVLLLWASVRVILIKRIEFLKKNIIDITQFSDLSKRISVSGEDELSIVITKINTLLDVIETSYTELESRVDERTQELQKANQLLHQEIDQHKITEKKLQTHKAHLNYMAHFDPLTALPNRILFNELLNKSIKYSQQNKTYLAILFLDLDRFKNINDTCGHPMGDKALRYVAQRLKQSLRNNDIIARLGGDEFIILVTDLDDIEIATIIAEKLLNVFVNPIVFDNHEFYLNASIGISVYPTDSHNLENLQKNADLAMYRAKKAGGGIYAFYTPEMEQWTHNRIEMETSLRRALVNDEFTLLFQPIMDLARGKVGMVEALLRWRHPQHGYIEPDKFINIAEETGLIIPIGEWVLRRACVTSKKWQQQGLTSIPITVNLSPLQLHDSNLVNTIITTLHEFDVSPQNILFEITESAALKREPANLEKLQKLHDFGIRFAIDDFGTGYSSISYLKQLPISHIKIDKSFIHGLPNLHDDASITRSIIGLSHDLGFKVVAEGVESQAQLNYLIENNCDMAQGYFFSSPISEEAIATQVLTVVY